MAKNDLQDRLKAQAEHKQQPADETIAAGEHMDLEAMDAAMEEERRAGAPMPTGVRLPAPSQSANPNLSEELQGMELTPKTFGPPQYGSPDPASAASRLMTLEDGHPLAGVDEGTAAISEDYGEAGPAQANDAGTDPQSGSEIDATDGAKELADEENVDLSQVQGTGQDGRITKSDVEDHIASQSNDDNS